MEERLDGLDVFVQQLDEILKNTTDTKQIAIVSLVADVKGKIGSTIDHPLSLSLLGALWILGSQITKDTNPDVKKQFQNVVKEVSQQGVLDMNTIKGSLEIATLVELGYIKDDEQAVSKRLIKMNTGFVYKQQKFNLEREETEGYSKLVLLLTTMPTNHEHVNTSIQGVFSLIGQFDLDPNRVLDLILDGFEQRPNNRSYFALLHKFRATSILHILGFKFAAYYSKGAPIASTDTAGGAVTTSNISTSNAAPFSLFTVAAALIVEGLVVLDDLLHYLEPGIAATATAIKEAEEQFRAALGAKGTNEFMSTNTLPLPVTIVPKLFAMRQGSAWKKAPLSSDGQDDRDKDKDRSSSTRDRDRDRDPPRASSSSSSSVLSTGAGSLSLSERLQEIKKASSMDTGKDAITAPPATGGSRLSSKAQAEKKAQLEKEAKELALTAEEQSLSSSLSLFLPISCDDMELKYPLLALAIALLEQKALKDAMRLLDAINTTLENGPSWEYLLVFSKKLRSSLLSLANWSLKPVTLVYNLENKENQVENVEMEVEDSSPLSVVTCKSSQLSSWRLVDDFPTLCAQVLGLLSYHIAENNELFVLFVESLRRFIVKHQLDDKEYTLTNSSEAQDLVARCVVQLLSGLACAGQDSTYLSSVLWRVISLLPFQLRYAVYDAYRSSLEDTEGLVKHAGAILAEKGLSRDVKNELKRLTKENTKMMGFKIAKALHAVPLVVSKCFITSVEAFDNLIPFAIEALKTSTGLSKDIMVYMLLLELRQKENERKMDDSKSVSYPAWFTALSRFTSSFFLRFYTTEIRGLLHYILKSLSQAKIADLLLIKDLLGIMGGCETLVEVSALQLEGLAGGRALRGEVMSSVTSTPIGTGIDSSHAKTLSLVAKKAASVLRDQFLASGTAMPLLLFIARMRGSFLFNTNADHHLKVMAQLYDIAQDILMQFTDFLVSEAKSLETIARIMPSFHALVMEVDLALPVAFQLVRPLMRTALQLDSSGNYSQSAETSREKISVEHTQLYMAWHPLSDAMTSVVATSTASVDGDVEEEQMEEHEQHLYMLFWALSLYDIYYPSDRYAAETKRIKDRYADLDSRKNAATAQSLGMTNGDYKRWVRQREGEMAPLMTAVVALTEESMLQKKHVDRMRDMLGQDKDRYFSSFISLPEGNNVTLKSTAWLLQKLIMPRIALSAADAVFSIKFLKLLHDLSVPGYNFLAACDALLAMVVPTLMACTESEAGFLGHALQEVLSLLTRWQRSEKLFELELKSKNPCLLVASTTAEASKEEPMLESHKSHEKYLTQCQAWHAQLSTNLLPLLQSNNEFMFIRCGLVFLSKVAALAFPSRKKDGLMVLKAVEKLAEGEQREDLQLMARSVAVLLKKAMPGWLNDMPPDPTPPVVAVHAAAGKDAGKSEKDSTKDNLKSDAKSKDSGNNNEKEKLNDKERVKDKTANLAAPPKKADPSPPAAIPTTTGKRKADNDRDSNRDLPPRDRDSRDRDRDNPPPKQSRPNPSAPAIALAPTSTASAGHGKPPPSTLPSQQTARQQQNENGHKRGRGASESSSNVAPAPMSYSQPAPPRPDALSSRLGPSTTNGNGSQGNKQRADTKDNRGDYNNSNREQQPLPSRRSNSRDRETRGRSRDRSDYPPNNPPSQQRGPPAVEGRYPNQREGNQGSRPPPPPSAPPPELYREQSRHSSQGHAGQQGQRKSNSNDYRDSRDNRDYLPPSRGGPPPLDNHGTSSGSQQQQQGGGQSAKRRRT